MRMKIAHPRRKKLMIGRILAEVIFGGPAASIKLSEAFFSYLNVCNDFASTSPLEDKMSGFASKRRRVKLPLILSKCGCLFICFLNILEICV